MTISKGEGCTGQSPGEAGMGFQGHHTDTQCSQRLWKQINTAGGRSSSEPGCPGLLLGGSHGHPAPSRLTLAAQAPAPEVGLDTAQPQAAWRVHSHTVSTDHLPGPNSQVHGDPLNQAGCPRAQGSPGLNQSRGRPDDRGHM